MSEALRMRRTRKGNVQCPRCRSVFVPSQLHPDTKAEAGGRETYHLYCPTCFRPVYWVVRDDDSEPVMATTFEALIALLADQAAERHTEAADE